MSDVPRPLAITASNRDLPKPVTARSAAGPEAARGRRATELQCPGRSTNISRSRSGSRC